VRSQVGVANGFTSLLVQDPKLTQVQAGTYSMTIEAVSDAQVEHDLRVRIIRKPKASKNQRPQLRLQLFVAETLPFDASSTGYTELVKHTQAIFGLADVDVRIVNVVKLDRSLSVIDDNVKLKSPFQTNSSRDERDVVKVFMVNQLALAETSWVTGYSFGIPGPASSEGIRNAGVIMTATSFPSATDSDNVQIGFAHQMSIALSHEVGHYLGLPHSREFRGGFEDPYSDTPSSDSGNLMDPEPTRGGYPTLSAQQIRALRAHPLVN
jgi:hypothetical protein